MSTTSKPTHHCPGLKGPVGDIPAGGCVVEPGTNYCKTHSMICKKHPDRFHLKKKGAMCNLCEGEQKAAESRAQTKAAQKKIDDAKAKEEAAANKKVRTKPRHKDNRRDGPDAPGAPGAAGATAE